MNGALSKAAEAVKSAELADEMLVEKESEAEQTLGKILQAHSKALNAAKESQSAHDLASEAKNRSKGELDRSAMLRKKIEDFSSRPNKASTADVATLAEECLNAELNLDESQIQDLAVQIEAAIENVADVDKILAETADDLRIAQDLKARAESVQTEAKAQLSSAESVTTNLSQAAVSQDAANDAVAQTRNDIDSARTDLGQITNDMDSAKNGADKLVMDVGVLVRKQQELQRDYIKNEQHVSAAKEAALMAKAKADTANTELYELNKGFLNVDGVLNEKTAKIGDAKDVAVDLQRRANALAANASNKLNVLTDVESEFEDNERRLEELSRQLMSLNCEMMLHLRVIEQLSNFYQTCTPPKEWNDSQSCVCNPGAHDPTCTSRRDVAFNK